VADCIIYPIPLVQLKHDKSMMTYRLNIGQPLYCANYAWYIEGPKEKILVDTGGASELFAERGQLDKVIQTLDTGLSKLGVSFNDIDLVILTHLHHDHVAHARRFPKARFIVQKDELEFAQNPHPAVATPFYKEFFDGLNFEVIEGDTSICEEISVLSTPGHTPGGQSVSIDTAQGKAIISGICSSRVNFEPPEPFNRTMPVFPYGVLVNLFDMYDSLLRIKEAADIIVPIHEPEYVQRSQIP